jgi:hypothetical protein
MRIVFSRKGFDSAAGGCASPIVAGRPRSLPIPTRSPSPFCFADLGHDIGEMVENLTGGRISRDARCHLDPDLDPHSLPARPRDWRGCFGQVGIAQAHLDRQAVGPGDLFLFWGLFRPAERRGSGWRFVGAAEHRIFGWLQVDEVLRVGPQGSTVLDRRPWLRDHPHARDGWGPRNTMYLASSKLILPGLSSSQPGWGLFRSGHRLTASGATRSVWSVPAWLDPDRGGVGLSFHAVSRRWDSQAGTLATVARGQEFVADTQQRPDAMQWLAGLWSEETP